jgi:hypothetical protein
MKTFNRNSQTAVSSFPRPNVEIGGLTLNAALEAGTSRVDPVGSSVLKWSDGELEGRAWNVDVAVHHAHGVDAQLVWHEVDRVKAVLDFSNDGFFDLDSRKKKLF